jgi:hypothetical protein
MVLVGPYYDNMLKWYVPLYVKEICTYCFVVARELSYMMHVKASQAVSSPSRLAQNRTVMVELIFPLT